MEQSYLDQLPPEITVLVGKYLQIKDINKLSKNLVLDLDEYLVYTNYHEFWKLTKDFILKFDHNIDWNILFRELKNSFSLCGTITAETLQANYSSLKLFRDATKVLTYYLLMTSGETLSSQLIHTVLWTKWGYLDDFLNIYDRVHGVIVSRDLIRWCNLDELVILHRIFKFSFRITHQSIDELNSGNLKDTNALQFIFKHSFLVGDYDPLKLILNLKHEMYSKIKHLDWVYKFGKNFDTDMKILKRVIGQRNLIEILEPNFPLANEKFIFKLVASELFKDIEPKTNVLSLLTKVIIPIRAIDIYKWIQRSDYKYTYGLNANQDLSVIKALRKTGNIEDFKDFLIEDGFQLIKIYRELFDSQNTSDDIDAFKIFKIILSKDDYEMLLWTQNNDFRFEYEDIKNRRILVELTPFLDHLDFNILIYLREDGFPFTSEERSRLFNESKEEIEYLSDIYASDEADEFGDLEEDTDSDSV